MKKLPTLFPKDPNNLRHVIVDKPIIDLSVDKVIPFIKFDGRACAIIDGKLYTRYDAKLFKRKRGKIIKTYTKEEVQCKLPKGAIACQEPDEKSGHWPHWIPCNPKNKDHEYIFEAFENSKKLLNRMIDGTYECVGPKVNTNPHNLRRHYLVPHFLVPLTNIDSFFEAKISFLKDNPEELYKFIKNYFERFPFEGIVFWSIENQEPIAKIRRSDFGLDEEKPLDHYHHFNLDYLYEQNKNFFTDNMINSDVIWEDK